MDIFTLAQLNKLKKSGGVGYSKTETIFPLTEISFNAEGYCIFEKAPFVLTAGNKYTVTYNGVEYNRIASDLTILEETFCFVGNLCFVEGEAPDTGEPFLIAYMGGTMSIMSAYPTATISVVGETIHPIDPKYLLKTIDLDSYGIGAVILSLFTSGGGAQQLADVGTFWKDVATDSLLRLTQNYQLDTSGSYTFEVDQSVRVRLANNHGTVSYICFSFMAYAGADNVHTIGVSIYNTGVGASVYVEVH